MQKIMPTKNIKINRKIHINIRIDFNDENMELFLFLPNIL